MSAKKKQDACPGAIPAFQSGILRASRPLNSNYQPRATSSYRMEDECAACKGTIFQVDDYQASFFHERVSAGHDELDRLQTGEEAPREPFKFAGYVTTIVASLFASLGVLFIKLLPVEDTIQEMSKACMIRGLFMVLFCGATIVCKGESFLGPPREYAVNFVRATLGALAILLIYVAIEFITMGECSALVYSSPVWTCLLGYLLLREPLPVSLFLAIPMSFLGIVLLAKPDLLVDLPQRARAATRDPSALDPEQRLYGIFIALAASLFMSGVIVAFRFKNTTSISTCSFQFGLALSAVAALVQLVVGFGALPSTWLEWALHLCIGLFSYGLQYLFQYSLQFVPAGSFSVIRSFDIVQGFVLGALFLNDAILWTDVVGSVLITVVVFVLMFNDYLKRAVKSVFCC